jgi:hypothetical protein
MLIMSTVSFVVICLPSWNDDSLTLQGQGGEWGQRFSAATFGREQRTDF